MPPRANELPQVGRRRNELFLVEAAAKHFSRINDNRAQRSPLRRDIQNKLATKRRSDCRSGLIWGAWLSRRA